MADDWSDEELEVAVQHYWKAFAQKGAERELDRSAFIKAALRAGLSSRGAGAVQRRMCNISAVMEANGKPWVIGWPPLRNVGTGVTPRIELLLTKCNLL